MSKEIDRRKVDATRELTSRDEELRRRASMVSESLPGKHRIRLMDIDSVTGNAAAVFSEEAPAERGNYVQRALEYVHQISGPLGFEAEQSPEFVADPVIQTGSSGAVSVHLQQRYKGLPIFQAARTVSFFPNGAIDGTVGNNLSVNQDVGLTADIKVEQAVLRAAQYIAAPIQDEDENTDQFGEPLPLTRVDVSKFTPKTIAAFPNIPEQPTVLEAGPFGDEIKASLIWFPLATDDLRLCWDVVLPMPTFEGRFRVLVDARTGEILYCHQLVQSVAARGNVFVRDGGSNREMVSFPRALTDYGLPLSADLPGQFPDDWVAADIAVGNSVNAHLGFTDPTITGVTTEDKLTFDPTPPAGQDQLVLNIFYFNCFMHDYFYLLGFREADGNFQTDNFSRGGLQGDAVDARAHAGAVWGTANMDTFVDGIGPVMNMGLVTATGRHTALDSTVVFHEFTHGVTNRLVGGPMNIHALHEPQSQGMSEGWGDYFACTINQTNVIGAWVKGKPGGIRRFPYDASFPDHFGMLGTGRYTEAHNIGEIWCATLMEMNRRIGNANSAQLVVDALKLAPANPGFLQMRDSILKALDNQRAAGQLTDGEYATSRKKIWEVFAKFGMGQNAASTGATLQGIVADSTVPT